MHYCDREYDLAEKRKRRSFFERNGDPQDATQIRLQHFALTVRNKKWLGSLVEIFKMPYMARESCKAELAKAISALPELRYVDLPTGFFGNDASCTALRQELQSRCPQIRRMKYALGTEDELLSNSRAQRWQNLEILELNGVSLDIPALLLALTSFSALREVKLQHMLSLDDNFFDSPPTLPPFPPVRTLALEDMPMITAHGIVSYLSRAQTRASLMHLAFAETGVLPEDLHTILSTAPKLQSLTTKEVVSRPFPLHPVPPLASTTLAELRFEILPAQSSPIPPSEGYYSYLTTSLLSGTLPALTSLFAYSTSLPDLLLFPPTAPFGLPSHPQRSPSPQRPLFDPTRTPSSGSHFSQQSATSTNSSAATASTPHLPLPSNTGLPGLRAPLHIYTKPAAYPELEWSLTEIDPPRAANGSHGSFSATRPLSMLREPGGRGRSASPGPGRHGRNGSVGGGGGGTAGAAGGGSAVLAGNHEYGGFLAVPAEDHGLGLGPGGGGGGGGGRGHGKKPSWNSEWMG